MNKAPSTASGKP
jgi:hypothetical protein